MKLFAPALLVISLPALANPGCKFETNGPLVIVDKIEATVKADQDAMVGAREQAMKVCENAGWRDCTGPQYKVIIQDYSVSNSSYKFQYSVAVTSAECAQFVADSKNMDKFSEGEAGYVRLETAKSEPVVVSVDCRPFNTSGAVIAASAAVPFQETCQPQGDKKSDARSPSNRSKIPGDGDGTGRVWY